VHGFKQLSEIDPQSYQQFSPDGMTPLNDAAFSAVGATNVYAKELMDKDYLANGIVFVITTAATTRRPPPLDDQGGNGTGDARRGNRVIDRRRRWHQRHELRGSLKRFAADCGMEYINAAMRRRASWRSSPTSSRSLCRASRSPWDRRPEPEHLGDDLAV